MNKTWLVGRLTKDPEVRYSQSERPMAIARYTLAVDRRGNRDKTQTADFIPCIAFDKAAEFAEKYLRQGMKMCICGRIQTGSYTNRDGQKVYTMEVVVEDQEFAESKSNQSGAAAAPVSVTESEHEKAKKGKKKMPAAEDEYMPIPEGEGMPFDDI